MQCLQLNAPVIIRVEVQCFQLNAPVIIRVKVKKWFLVLRAECLGNIVGETVA